MSDDLRDAYRGGRIVKCQFVTEWDLTPPEYVHAYEPKTGQHFVVSQQMGAWMDVDVSRIVRILNGEFSEASTRASFREMIHNQGKQKK